MTTQTSTSGLRVVETCAALREQIATWRQAGEQIGFVPTMGFLHEGHLSLIRIAAARTTHVVVSLFVNPTQFGPGEDLERYPRDLEGDREKVEAAGGALLFVPSVEEMYPPGAQTFVEVEKLTQPLCGVDRPTHFRGVTTIVCKLFHLVQPDVAVFGQKDYQQLAVIRQMVRDLLMDIEIIGGPTVREADGLAMSSRNAYLDPVEREAATCLSRAIRVVRTAFRRGEHGAKALLALAREVIEQTPLADVQYLELRREDDLALVDEKADPTDRLFLAVKIGTTRLIDNAPLGGTHELDKLD